ncbi:DNA polymerase I [uncultured Roseburia sp.]|uniref:DNA polymerase I n=1 Tax=Brotonthovivens ammoniilytica TaxID=2981725 RepID=A0ABT2TPV0_9FIRM|nr:DNA polymerase I [Brotonthovivens ammoniilytica]MCU6763484.1 DNA polymerase I [Brotonthovivens ammoniilytica]SCJ20940.1 DNA polymerase I [uncultured Roseburia sp.]
MNKKIVLIDGHSILNRAFFGIPDLTNSEGLHTNAVYGFLNILFKILDEEKPDYLTVAFDVHAPTFRHKMFEDYKGTRKPMAEELRQQVPVMKEVLQAMGIVIMEKEGYEADDILGTIARQCEEAGLEVSIVSGDRDLLQLATEHTKIRIPKTKRTGTEIEDYYARDVVDKYQVTPGEFIDVKALMGDTADNIPGVPGIGEKTATNLITAFHSIENAYEHLEEIKPPRAQNALREHYDMACMSKTLAAIDVHAGIEYQIEDALLKDFYTEEAYVYFKRLEFKNMLSRFELDTPKNQAEQHFKTITMLDEAETFFAEASQELGRSKAATGIALIAEKGQIYGISVSLSEEKTVFIKTEGFLTESYLLEKIQMLASCAALLVTPDLKALLKQISIPEEQSCFDTTIAAYLLNPLKNEYSYDDLAKDYLNLMIPSRMDLIGKLSFAKANEEKEEELNRLACYTAYISLACHTALEKQLEETQMLKLYRSVEMPLAFTLADMEMEGICVDAEALKIYGEELSVKIQELEQKIYDQAGERFNINSPKQLGGILFDKLNMPNGKKTKTGYSTAADVLDKLALDYPIVSDILEYRQLTKLKSTYADGLAAYILTDGRIHGTFNQTITATGRLSSTEPNLQNIPIRMELGRLIRKVFLPKDGFVFLDADYSQIELRVLAHMSGDKNLIEAYRHAEDIHRVTASQVFHTPFEEVTDLQRRNAKAVNFGIVYGISSFGLSQDLSITRKEAEMYIKSYFETYPGIKEFLDRLVKDAKDTGYAVTMFGRRRPVPELFSSNFMQRSFGERIAMNSPIQGTAADIIKIAMNRVRARLKKEQLKSKLILQVHDELLIETADNEVEQVKQILNEEMQNAAHLEVRLETDTKEGSNWYEAH